MSATPVPVNPGPFFLTLSPVSDELDKTAVDKLNWMIKNLIFYKMSQSYTHGVGSDFIAMSSLVVKDIEYMDDGTRRRMNSGNRKLSSVAKLHFEGPTFSFQGESSDDLPSEADLRSVIRDIVTGQSFKGTVQLSGNSQLEQLESIAFGFSTTPPPTPHPTLSPTSLLTKMPTGTPTNLPTKSPIKQTVLPEPNQESIESIENVEGNDMTASTITEQIPPEPETKISTGSPTNSPTLLPLKLTSKTTMKPTIDRMSSTIATNSSISMPTNLDIAVTVAIPPTSDPISSTLDNDKLEVGTLSTNSEPNETENLSMNGVELQVTPLGAERNQTPVIASASAAGFFAVLCLFILLLRRQRKRMIPLNDEEDGDLEDSLKDAHNRSPSCTPNCSPVRFPRNANRYMNMDTEDRDFVLYKDMLSSNDPKESSSYMVLYGDRRRSTENEPVKPSTLQPSYFQSKDVVSVPSSDESVSSFNFEPDQTWDPDDAIVEDEHGQMFVETHTPPPKSNYSMNFGHTPRALDFDNQNVPKKNKKGAAYRMDAINMSVKDENLIL